MEQQNMTQQQVAEIIGKSRSAVANTLRILNLDERVINLALEGKLSEGHCRSLLRFENLESHLILITILLSIFPFLYLFY